MKQFIFSVITSLLILYLILTLNWKPKQFEVQIITESPFGDRDTIQCIYYGNLHYDNNYNLVDYYDSIKINNVSRYRIISRKEIPCKQR